MLMGEVYRFSQRLEKLPQYLFATLDGMKREALSRGVDVIDLGIGDPDIPTPGAIIDKLREKAGDPENHRYPSYEGMLGMREAVSRWYGRRFGVELDPGDEILTLIGSKEGIGHIPLAFINPGDSALIPDPGYPVYNAGVVFAGGECIRMPLLKENGFIPDLNRIPRNLVGKIKIMFINYPNNPTGAVAGLDFFREVVEFAGKFGIIICHDAAYSEIYYNGYKPPSFLQAQGARDVGIEFHSLSKTFNMTGWRIGFAAGSRRILQGLGRVKTNLDSGVFQAVQYAGIEALDKCAGEHAKILDIYRERRDVLVEGLEKIGWKVEKPKASFYVWLPALDGMDSLTTAKFLLENSGVVVAPGTGFGEFGEGFVRMSITVSREKLAEAVRRIAGAIGG